jgi:hypothetical protein
VATAVCDEGNDGASGWRGSARRAG